jgi:hypothetical protein
MKVEKVTEDPDQIRWGTELRKDDRVGGTTKPGASS